MHAAAEREHLLDSQRAVLLEEKLRAESHAGASKVRLAAEVEALARQRRELWQRLKRQAVVQAASVRQLQCSLSASRAEQAAIRAQAEAEQLTALAKLALCEAELALLRESHRSNEAYHTRRLAASGVVAIKHGRKGKPHPRHIRCVGERLEWAKAEIATRSAETLRTLRQSISAGGELGDLGVRKVLRVLDALDHTLVVRRRGHRLTSFLATASGASAAQIASPSEACCGCA